MEGECRNLPGIIIIKKSNVFVQIVNCLSVCLCLRVDSSSHQGKWVSAIALLAACPTMVRTAGAAKRCRTTTDNFNLSLIIFFKFYHSFNVKMKSFLTSSSNWPIVNPSWNNTQYQMRQNIKIAFVAPKHLPKFLLQ